MPKVIKKFIGNTKISYVFGKTLVLSVISNKWIAWKIFKKERSVQNLKILDLVENV